MGWGYGVSIPPGWAAAIGKGPPPPGGYTFTTGRGAGGLGAATGHREEVPASEEDAFVRFDAPAVDRHG